MAVRVNRKNNKPVETDTADVLKTLVLKYFTRFDAIDVYAGAILSKLEEAIVDIEKGADAKSVVLHLVTLKQLAQDIQAQVEQATTDDMKG